ncbi:hypothetical protein [Acidianus sp. HS-5]|uniref:hypothetical protein n=1 Tax=Acidianus sp. HS-5 TaxID=2886040 RepID=UPI001F2FE862|nr:hypothetical protein [Acidianus sp. HS-5]BDC17957.1 hypothetical protein HS5_08470 [Acidianus sp. HS-5]
MEWKINTKKLNKETEDYSCLIDDITNSEEIERLSKKYSISRGVIHEFVTEFLIKVLKEKKNNEDEIVRKFSMPKEIVEEVKRQASSSQ